MRAFPGGNFMFFRLRGFPYPVATGAKSSAEIVVYDRPSSGKGPPLIKCGLLSAGKGAARAARRPIPAAGTPFLRARTISPAAPTATWESAGYWLGWPVGRELRGAARKHRQLNVPVRGASARASVRPPHPGKTRGSRRPRTHIERTRGSDVLAPAGVSFGPWAAPKERAPPQRTFAGPVAMTGRALYVCK